MRVKESRSRTRCARWCTTLALGFATLLPSTGFGRGPDLPYSESGRRRVRGERPEGASIHLAWGPAPTRRDTEHTEALAAFERAAFPDTGPRQTIVTRPPDSWMAKLTLPDLPVRWNQRTVEYLRYFKDDPKGQAMMKAWMRRAGRYEARLRAIFREVGVPEDLVMVALAESGFDPRVRSRVGAAGLWQFMEGTGAVYGLQRDYWVDERFDVERSTRAAALYLKDLETRFGSWELALAAYNAGYGLVMTTIERHNTNNYWSLCEIESGLPYATTNYVPKIVAAALVSRNRDVFGVGSNQIEALPPAEWIEVRIPRSTSIATLARALDADADLLEELNAHLIRGRTPPRRGGIRVRIPRDKQSAYEAAYPELQKGWTGETVHRVRHAESLAEIAYRYGIGERELRAMNGIEDSAEIVGGVELVVPAPGTREPEPDLEPPQPPIAAVPPLQPRADSRLVFVKTTRALTPASFERAFGVDWTDVVRWNDLDPMARIQDDQVLQLVVPGDYDPAARELRIYEPNDVVHVARGSAEHIEAALERRGLRRRGYRARKGEDLRRIGRRFNLSVGDLARINGFSRGHEPEPGEILVVYVPPTREPHTIEAPPPPGFGSPGRSRARRRDPLPSTAETSRVPGKPPAPPTDTPSTVEKRRSDRRPSTASTNRLPGAR